MNTVSIIKILVEQHGCKLLSAVGPAPSDIDLYISYSERDKARRYLIDCGFVLAYENSFQLDLRRFENGELYIIDLLSDFNLYASFVGTFSLSERGNSALANSQSLSKAFKYLCCNRLDKLSFLETCQAELIEFFSNKNNFNFIFDFNPSTMSVVEILRALNPPPSVKYLTSRVFYKKKISKLMAYYKVLGKGYSMAFIGPDGSGKSFVINKMRDVGSTQVIYMGDWFFHCQGFYNKIMKIPTPYNRFIYLFYLIENLLRSAKVWFHKLLGRIVLIDRFPGTNRNAVHKGLLGMINRSVFKLFPKPDLLVLLDAPAEIVFERKQELSIQEITTLQWRLKEMLKGERHIVLDSRDLDKALNYLLTMIYQKRNLV